MKSEDQIQAAEKELYERRWHERSKMLAPADPRAGKDVAVVEARRQVEEDENLGPYDDFEWGRILLADDATWDDWLGDT
jgi:hypothetical protein